MRIEILKSLISLSKPIQEIKKSLGKVEWDGDEEVILSRAQSVALLQRYLDSDVDIGMLTEWANTVEGRDDIDYEEAFFSDIKQLIYEIANPTLEGHFSPIKAKNWLTKLSK